MKELKNVGSARAAMRRDSVALRDARNQAGGGARSVGHHGVFLAMHTAPLPDVAEYENWFVNSCDQRSRSRLRMSGAKLRRMAIMRRQGSTLQECAGAAGVTKSSAATWMKRLPEGLRP